jgi:hypothetical protein
MLPNASGATSWGHRRMATPVASRLSFRLAIWLGGAALLILACVLVYSIAIGSRGP